MSSSTRHRIALLLALAIVLTACGIGSSDDSASNGDELYQIGTLAELSAGGYDGLIALDELLDHGDFGLGTFDALDGEMVILDGTIYRIPASGQADKPDGDATTPFAVVTSWDADAHLSFPDPMSCADFQASIDAEIDTDAPYAIKVTGHFALLLTRSPGRQEPPYAPLDDVLQNQIVFELPDAEATITGFRLPEYMAGANATGYHFHAITADERAGGHVLDCQTASVTVELDRLDSWYVQLSAN